MDDLPRTQLLYFDSYDLVEFESLVVKQIDPRHLVLEKTVFYPTSGGQEHDTGTLRDEDGNEYRIVDVIKQGGVVIHVLAEDVDLSPGDPVHGMIDWERRRQLAQHHTATHVINGAARKVLGNHVWQAGAAKTTEKGRIDLTHYENLDADQVRSIEEEANAIVQANIEVCHAIVPKQEAESRHGFRLYQGGAVPGSEIRVVDIPGFDVEACGGTHLNRTGELGMIRILKSSKVQDGIVRLEYVAGAQAELYERERKGLLEEMQRLLGVDDERLLPSACEELFARWKARRKGKAHEGRPLEPYEDDPLARCSEILKTPKDQLLNTIRKFLRDLEA